MRRACVILTAVLTVFLLVNPLPAAAQAKEEIMEAQVTRMLEEKTITVLGKKQHHQKIELKITKGSREGETIVIEAGALPVANDLRYKPGDRLTIAYSKDARGNDLFLIRDFIRREYLYALFAVFLVLAVLIARMKAITSFLGMGFSFFIIFTSILPNILSGRDPVIAVVLASLFIVPVTFVLSHGMNRKTVIAVLSTFLSIIITGVLSAVFVHLTRLTGFSSEEAGFLQIYKGGAVNMQGILLAGIIIGAMGVLDDITVSQASIVYELKETDRKLTRRQLYGRAMNIGRDHISSIINTLVLVYAGASLPLMLLFVHNPHPFSEIINYEMVAEEIVRTLVGSIGLVLAVPITTILAAMTAVSSRKQA